MNLALALMLAGIGLLAFAPMAMSAPNDTTEASGQNVTLEQKPTKEEVELGFWRTVWEFMATPFGATPLVLLGSNPTSNSTEVQQKSDTVAPTIPDGDLWLLAAILPSSNLTNLSTVAPANDGKWWQSWWLWILPLNSSEDDVISVNDSTPSPTLPIPENRILIEAPNRHGLSQDDAQPEQEFIMKSIVETASIDALTGLSIKLFRRWDLKYSKNGPTNWTAVNVSGAFKDESVQCVADCETEALKKAFERGEGNSTVKCCYFFTLSACIQSSCKRSDYEIGVVETSNHIYSKYCGENNRTSSEAEANFAKCTTLLSGKNPGKEFCDEVKKVEVELRAVHVDKVEERCEILDKRFFGDALNKTSCPDASARRLLVAELAQLSDGRLLKNCPNLFKPLSKN